MPPLPADSIHARACKLKCEKILTRPVTPFGNWWMGWRFTTSFWAEKKQEIFFQISCSVCRCVGGGYLVVKVRDKLTRCVSGKLEVFSSGYISTYNLSIWLNHYFNNMPPKHIIIMIN